MKKPFAVPCLCMTPCSSHLAMCALLPTELYAECHNKQTLNNAFLYESWYFIVASDPSPGSTGSVALFRLIVYKYATFPLAINPLTDLFSNISESIETDGNCMVTSEWKIKKVTTMHWPCEKSPCRLTGTLGQTQGDSPAWTFCLQVESSLWNNQRETNKDILFDSFEPVWISGFSFWSLTQTFFIQHIVLTPD